MHRSLRKFTFFCADHMFQEAINLVKSIEGVRLLHVFDDHFQCSLDRKNRFRKLRRRKISGVCPERKMDEVVRLLALKNVYGFTSAVQVSFSELELPLVLQA